MKPTIAPIPANPDEIELYCVLGEALAKTQIVEQALSHSITLKLNSTATKKEADEFLDKQLRYTLGNAVNLGNREKLYNPSLQTRLYDFLDKRNWLIHKAIAESRVDIRIDVKNKLFLDKIQSISVEAERLQHEIELDLVVFCEARGRDMSATRKILNARPDFVTQNI